MYASMCSRSTIAGQLVLGADRELNGDAAFARAARAAPRATRKKSARSRSSMFTKTTRERPSSSARCQSRGRLHLDAHDAADTTTSAPSTTRKRGDRVALEAGVAGRVDQVDLAALPLDVASGGRERHLAPLLVLVPVGDGGAGLDRPEPVDRPGLEEQRLDERGLPRPAVADDGDVADLARLELACASSSCDAAKHRCVLPSARRGEPK